MTTRQLAIDIEDVLAARERVLTHIHRTPVVTSRQLDAAASRKLFLKAENLQRTGSFKIRGATNKLRSLDDAERRRGVVAFSSGNHAQAVALAAASLGVSATIAMPDDAPASKIAATLAYGATIVRYNRQRDDRESVAQAIVEREGRVLVPPYDDPYVMAGQGTAALELFEEVPDLDCIVVPVGGGGLLSGSATVARAVRPSAMVYGVEPAAANDTALSLAAGERVTIAPPVTIADGARPQSPGRLTFDVIRSRADGVVTVADADLVGAMRWLLTRTKLVVEPTGALALAAVLAGALPVDAKRIGVLLSGGNVDPETLAALLAGPVEG